MLYLSREMEDNLTTAEGMHAGNFPCQLPADVVMEALRLAASDLHIALHLPNLKRSFPRRRWTGTLLSDGMPDPSCLGDCMSRCVFYGRFLFLNSDCQIVISFPSRQVGIANCS